MGTSQMSKVIIFHHMPKTGGKSLRSILEKTFPHTVKIDSDAALDDAKTNGFRPRIKAIFGHSAFGAHLKLANYQYLTVFRHPYERFKSSFKHIHRVRDTYKGMYRDFGYNLKNLETYARMGEWNYGHNFMVKKYLHPKFRHLAVTPRLFRAACANLEKYFWVTSTPEMDNTIPIWGDWLGVDFQGVGTRINTDDGAIQNLDDCEDLYRYLNQYDYAFYQFAADLMEKQLRNGPDVR